MSLRRSSLPPSMRKVSAGDTITRGMRPICSERRRYSFLSRRKCFFEPRFMPQEDMRSRKKYLADIAREYKADGLIVASNKFCEYWSYERTIDTLIIPRDFGIPVCSIEKEYVNNAVGQLRTRFQAFVESIELKNLRKEGA